MANPEKSCSVPKVNSGHSNRRKFRMAPCARCKSESAPHLIRTHYMCRECFIQWVRGKVSHRMSSFRVGSGPVKRVLVAISFGCCSLSLLALLARHRENMVAKTSRVGYEVSVLHVLDADTHEEPASALRKLKQLEEMFPMFTFNSAALKEALETSQDQESRNDPLSVEQLAKLSASSHEDMMLILRNRLITKKASDLSCESILFGDSTTKMSARILAETAKGRGFAIPQLIGDAQPEHGIRKTYPLGDIFRAEIEEYARHIEPALWALSNRSAEDPQQQTAASRTVSHRNMTIDKLLEQYVTELEVTTPSIVSNVMRTSQKLAEPEREFRCLICGLAMDRGTSGLHGWGGDQDIDLTDAVAKGNRGSELCYGCARSLYGQ